MNSFNIYSMICLLAFIFEGGVTPAFCMEYLLTPARQGIIARRRRCFLWILDSFLISFPKIVGATDSGTVITPFLMGIIGIISQIFIILFLYRGKYFYRLAIFALYAISGIVGDFILSLLYFSVTGDYFEMIYRTFGTTVICILDSLIIFLNCLLMVLFFGKKKTKKPNLTLPMTVMPLAIILCLFLCGLPEKISGTSIFGTDLYFAAVSIVFTIYSFIGVVLELAQKRDADREMAELDHTIALQRLHYESVEKRRDEMAGLRHDYRNVLTATLFLLENGQTKEACSLLDDMVARVSYAKQNAVPEGAADSTSESPVRLSK